MKWFCLSYFTVCIILCMNLECNLTPLNLDVPSAHTVFPLILTPTTKPGLPVSSWIVKKRGILWLFLNVYFIKQKGWIQCYRIWILYYNWYLSSKSVKWITITTRAVNKWLIPPDKHHVWWWCKLDLGQIMLGQGHDTFKGHDTSLSVKYSLYFV